MSNWCSVFIICCIATSPFKYAFGQILIADAQSFGLGLQSTLMVNAWSLVHNPATLGLIKKSGGSIGYLSPYAEPKELSQRDVIYTNHSGYGALGMAVSQFGFSEYQRNSYHLGYGMLINAQFTLGVRITYSTIRLGENYGQRNNILAGLGMTSALNKFISIGASIHNVTQAKLSEYQDEKIPSVQQLGIKYVFSDQSHLMCEIVQSNEQPSLFKIGFSYQVTAQTFFRIGVLNTNSPFAFGLGYQYKKLQIDMATMYHTTLGHSPILSISYTPKNDQ